jgi:uncharacterized OB-fold protein
MESAPRVGVEGVSADDAAPYWKHLGVHELFVQQCGNCAKSRFPPMPGCPHCGSLDAEWIKVDDGGTIYSWVRVHRTTNPSFVAETPYVLVTVDLAPGCRIVGRLEGSEAPRMGQPVTLTFIDHAHTTELRFRPGSRTTNSPQEPDHND